MSEEEKLAKSTPEKSLGTAKRIREKKTQGALKSLRPKSKRAKNVALSDDMLLFPSIKEIREEYSAGEECQPLGARRFIQVEKGNLLTYLAYGLIYPVSLEDRDIVRTQSRARDPQSLCPDALVISPGFLQNAEEDQVLIEVALSKEENDHLAMAGAHALLAQPLPVSRIAAVWTLNQKARNNLLASAKTFSDAPLPAKLVYVAPETLIAACPELDLTRAAVPQLPSELGEKKKLFDQMLGMFAFMRNTEKYFSCRTHRYCDYSKGYIPALVKANPAIQAPPLSDEERKAGEFYFGLLMGKPTDPFFNPIIEIVRAGGNFDKMAVEKILETHRDHLSPTAASAVIKAFAELFDDGFKQCIQILGQTQGVWHYAILAMLYRFHKRGSNDKQNIKSVFPDVISDPKRAEIALAILGLYYGYASLPKDETVDTIELPLAPMIGRNHAIKYDLKSVLDRTTIETVFQIAHKGKSVDSPFDYLPVVPSETTEKPPALDDKVQDLSYMIMGTCIRVFKVSDEAEQITRLIRDTYNSQWRKPFYLAIYAIRRSPHIVKAVHVRTDMQVEVDVDLEGFLGAIPKLVRTDAAEIRACVDADRKHVYQIDKK